MTAPSTRDTARDAPPAGHTGPACPIAIEQCWYGYCSIKIRGSEL